MAEEQKFQDPTNHHHVLCANNCGFFGSPTTLNLCSKCYKDHCQLSSAVSAVENGLKKPESTPSSSASGVVVRDLPTTTSCDDDDDVVVLLPGHVGLSVPVTKQEQQQVRNRCGSCNKRVGLTGFRCKCEMIFCGTHRFPEKHACSFDFKTVGKEAIAKANPVVKGVKLNKI